MSAEHRVGGAMLADECGERRRRVGAEMPGRKLDALLVGQGANLRYLSGFTGSNALLLLFPEESILFTDPRYTIQAARETSAAVRVCRGPLLPEVIQAVKRKRVRRLGFEQARMSCETFDALASRMPPKASLEPVSGWIERHRMIKSERELEAIRASAALNSEAFEQAVGRIRPGILERDLAAELEYRMRRLGADKPAFETIVAAGERSALPHASPTAALLKPGALLLVDMGAMRDGYASDMTRMLFLGRPGARVRRLYRAVEEAQRAALDAVRPGATAGQVDRRARQVLRAHGLARAFVHSTGHGLGLEIHEPPRLGKAEKTRLEPGMAITIEPGVYLEGYGGIRIEDTVAVTRSGCEILTPTSKELRTI